MIIWSGWGFMVAVIVFVASLVTELTVESAFADESYYQSHAWPLVVALLVSAAVAWLWGSHLNKQPGRTMIDKETGAEVVVGGGGHHRLFFIPMQYWGPILAALAIASPLLR